jgi:hypothetical protein
MYACLCSILPGAPWFCGTQPDMIMSNYSSPLAISFIFCPIAKAILRYSNLLDKCGKSMMGITLPYQRIGSEELLSVGEYLRIGISTNELYVGFYSISINLRIKGRKLKMCLACPKASFKVSFDKSHVFLSCHL